MAITCWTQNHDYKSEDHGAVVIEQAESVLRDFDWAAETSRFAQGVLDGSDVCPPGVGFNDGKGLFHLYANDSSSWELRVELPRQGKWLGLIPKPCKEHTIPIKGLDEAVDHLRLFFTDQSELASRLGQQER